MKFMTPTPAPPPRHLSDRISNGMSGGDYNETFQATNDSDYTLLASDDVSIFFDNSFVTKTSLTSVSPGESFQTFLGIDPAVKVVNEIRGRGRHARARKQFMGGGSAESSGRSTEGFGDQSSWREQTEWPIKDGIEIQLFSCV